MLVAEPWRHQDARRRAIASRGARGVDEEARHLREVRGGGEVEDVHVVEDLVAGEAAEDEEAAVDERRRVRPAWGRDVSNRLRARPLHRLCPIQSVYEQQKKRSRRARTDIKTQNIAPELLVIAPAKQPDCGIIDNVRRMAAHLVCRACTPDGCATPVHQRWWRR